MDANKQPELLENETIARVAAYWGSTPEKLLRFMEDRIAEEDYYTLWALGAFPVINMLLSEALSRDKITALP